MKRALIVIASVGILAVTVAMESANAQVTRPYRAPPPYAGPAYTPQSRGRDRPDAPRTAPFSNTVPFSNPDSPATGGSLGYNQYYNQFWK
jgi:hypothetical protein